MVPLKEGVLHVTGLVYTLQLYQTSPNVPQKRTEATPAGGTLSLASHGDVGGIQGQRDLSVRGLRLNRTIVERTSVMYGPDHRLSWTIRPTAPRLKVLTHHKGVGVGSCGGGSTCESAPVCIEGTYTPWHEQRWEGLQVW